MLTINCSKKELIELINKTVNNLMEDNRENFKQHQQIMTPLSSQISVLATIQILSELGLINTTNMTNDIN